MATNEEKCIDALLHHPKQSQDTNCPDIEWMGEDLTHCSGVGEWKCKLQDDSYGDLLYGGGSENKDYKPCNCSDHNNCSIYRANHKQ